MVDRFDFYNNETYPSDNGAYVLHDDYAAIQASHARLLEALKQISAIEDMQHGGDWEEIGQARDIALEAIAAARQFEEK